MERTIAILAQKQLAQWQAYAMTEQVQYRFKDSQVHMCCIRCGQTMIPVHDGMNAYLLNQETMRAAIVAHLRQNHEELEAEVYTDE
jgi:hypothetical protein